MKKQKNHLNDLSGKDWVRNTKSWFTMNDDDKLSKNLDKSWLVVDGKKADIPKDIEQHPASFPPELIEKFISFFTKKGQYVLDPFLGIGSTMVACFNLDRNGIGIELNEKYAEYSKKRVKSLLSQQKFNRLCNLTEKPKLAVIQGDSLKVLKNMELPKFDFCITSPPYWDMLHKTRGNIKSTMKIRIENGLDQTYGNNPSDLGNIQNYQDYLDKLSDIFFDIYDKLNDGAHVVIILQNVRTPEGIMIPVAWDVAKMLSSKYKLLQEFIWCQNQKFLGCWGYPSAYVSNVHHHYCIVLQKPRSNQNVGKGL